jgi:phospholipase/lecithinase/hemolysin
MISYRFTPLRLISKSVTFVIAVLFAAISFAQTPPTFTKLVVFGDSLSDNGNIAHRVSDDFPFTYPGGDFDYSDHRFTNSSDTVPSSDRFAGVWHEQLARSFLHLPRATNSLDGGMNYAFGGATSVNGSSERTVIHNPNPFSGGDYTITIDNMGKQVDDFLAAGPVDPNALYLLWGGSNDIFDDSTAANVVATSLRINALIRRLAVAGARNFLIPNSPPLGSIPNYNGHTAKIIALDAASAAYRTRLNLDLDATIRSLATQGITVRIYRLDAWMNTIRILAEPDNYGFTNIRDSARFDAQANPDEFLFWDEIHPTTAGHYQIALDAYNVLRGAVQPIGKALNLSTRASVGNADSVAIAGFVISGTNAKRIAVRALGPSLSAYGIQGPLPDPTLTLYDSVGRVITTNDNWRNTQQAEIQATGLAPHNIFESAIVRTLAPGAYTAVLRGKNGVTGVGLAEVYDLSSATASLMVNLSTRGFVGTGESVLIAGFAVGAGDKPIVALRAVGPSLTSFGVAGALQDPVLELHNVNGVLIATNDNWKSTQESAVAATGFAPSDVRESAIVKSLAPGNYTAIVRGKANTTGVALVEVNRIQ